MPKPPLTLQRLGVLNALLREAKIQKTITKHLANAILDNACHAGAHLTPDLLKQIGQALSKTEGIDAQVGDPDPVLTEKEA